MAPPTRLRVDELMDGPDIAAGEHHLALAGLEKINRLSHVVDHLLPPILDLAGRLPRQEIELLDVACGGADVPLELARRAGEAGVHVKLTLLDRSETALEHAAGRARRMGVAYTVVCSSALHELPPADVVSNSLFLHHLDEADVVAGLANMAVAARRLLLVSDLRRSRVGLAAAWAGCRLLSRSAIVRYDGPASVRAAWTIDEMARMAIAAGLTRASIRPTWPWRMLLTWEREATA